MKRKNAYVGLRVEAKINDDCGHFTKGMLGTVVECDSGIMKVDWDYGTMRVDWDYESTDKSDWWCTYDEVRIADKKPKEPKEPTTNKSTVKNASYYGYKVGDKFRVLAIYQEQRQGCRAGDVVELCEDDFSRNPKFITSSGNRYINLEYLEKVDGEKNENF